FRLLRADLLLPLRESVLQYLANHERSQLRGVCIYTEVRIVRPICSDKGLCFRLSFDVSRSRRFNWAASQRLKYGSLLCLSADNFTNYHCAVVDNREVKDLERGLVDVQFLVTDQGDARMAVEESIALFAQARDLRFNMVESPAYFEAYKHVLLGLQNITENTFPFWRYIGECNQEVRAPAYLREHEGPVMYDLRTLVDHDYTIGDDEARLEDDGFKPEAAMAKDVDILRLETWPNSNTLSLDTSQYIALQSALTREFSIVQGPPGTGKTFLGLKIMRVLLQNRHMWAEGGAGGERQARRNQTTPILLVCYTNHALDQFLEGVLEFFQGNLVRVGSRSKSEALDEYNLRGLRRRARENRTVPVQIHMVKQQTRLEMKNDKVTIHQEAAKLEILEREIVKETFLKDFMEPHHLKQLTQSSRMGKTILVWLKIASAIHKIEAQRGQDARGQYGYGRDQDVAYAAIAAAQGEEDSDEDGEEDDEDDFFEIVTADAANRFLDIGDDDELGEDMEDDLFSDLRDDFGSEMKEVNRRLDDVDREAEMLRALQVAFNISEYGEELMPPNLDKERKKRWKAVNQLKKKYRFTLLGWLQNTDKMDPEEARRVQNVWKLPVRQRWRLYRHWVDMHCRQLRGAIRDLARSYEEKARRYQEILHQEDKAILEKATILGMTTTAAARYQAVLREIGPSVVIVEEAAEVLEGHVLTALSEHCQHVVLIGDHKQLRPNPAVYKLKNECALDISLFERLVNNNLRYDQLRYQHRMRPEISELMKIRELYPTLQDHEKVMNYPHVCNVSTNLCFIQHEELDQQEEDTNTFSNHYEARFIVGLCEYLLLQGYSPRQMTILSPYKGQIQLIKTQLKRMVHSKTVADKMEKGGLKISSVDNYQGEENDIILLSLVRSNVDNDIGFLKANNRLCVALSRAKQGLYVIGNLQAIAEKSELMRNILQVANRRGVYKKYLPLSCPRHRNAETRIKTPDDFKNVPDGGCKRPCQARLDCGHACKRVCHADDPDHRDAACGERCRELCTKCGQHCKENHPCGKHDVCKNLVRKRIPMCGHEQDVPCHMSADRFQCQHQCSEQLPCGHTCGKVCGSRHDHTRDTCTAPVEVTPRFCGHGSFLLPCRDSVREDAANVLCPEPCPILLECEHPCSGTCGLCHNGRLHVSCQEICKKILICGHSCRDKCGSCPPCTRPCETACQHSHCTKLCGEPCTPCLELCQWRCEHHECKDLCCQPCERDPCDEPCPKRLACGHRCCGLCGEECPKLCSRCDVEKLKADSLYGYDGDRTTRFVQLDCGHVLEAEFVDQWMITKLGTEEGSDQTVIGLKTCPLCKVPIRKCQRYSNAIKTQLRLIERVKRRCVGERRPELEERLRTALNELGVAERRDVQGLLQSVVWKTQLRLIERVKRRCVGERRPELEERLRTTLNELGVAERRDVQGLLQSGPRVLSETILEAQIRQVTIFRQIRALRRVTVEMRGRFPELPMIENRIRRIDRDLRCFETWATKIRTVFSEQNRQDASLELDRLRLLLGLLKIAGFFHTRAAGQGLTDAQRDAMREALVNLSAEGQTNQEIVTKSQNLLEDLTKIMPDIHIALTAKEKMDIVRAVNVQTGAWYQCPNGHIYAIGECGQAMEESRCPECHARIGGTNHRLLDDNAQAPEMDGAERPVWDNLDADRELAEMLQRAEFELF
ncbi:nfx1-type Zinc finger-containing protein 1-like, partial [Plakobranchus ocellatus]